MEMSQLMKELRLKKGLTQVELSKITDIPVRTIQDIECGKVNINNTASIRLYKLSKALGVKMESLIERETIKVEKDEC